MKQTSDNLTEQVKSNPITVRGAGARRSNTICASTSMYVLATHGTTCTVHCNYGWLIT